MGRRCVYCVNIYIFNYYMYTDHTRTDLFKLRTWTVTFSSLKKCLFNKKIIKNLFLDYIFHLFVFRGYNLVRWKSWCKINSSMPKKSPSYFHLHENVFIAFILARGALKILLTYVKKIWKLIQLRHKSTFTSAWENMWLL